MHCCKRVWKLPYTHFRRSSSVAATSSTVACLSSWIVMICLRNTRFFKNPHRKKSDTVRSGDRAGQAVSLKLWTQVTRCTFQHSIATDHMKWRPLLYHSSSRQPQQAILPVQYSYLKCVSRLCTTQDLNQYAALELCTNVIIWGEKKTSHNIHKVNYILIHAQKVITYLHIYNSWGPCTEMWIMWTLRKSVGKKVIPHNFY